MIVAGQHRVFGRHHIPDPRDRRFRMAPRRGFRLPDRGFRYWADHRWMGDQKDTPHCVGFSWAHWLHCAPFRQWLHPVGIYRLAQLHDEWAGNDYEGTSVRGGAKALAQLGFIGAYHWASSAREVALALQDEGPVVVGTDWTDGMSIPDSDGTIRPEGNSLGGHAYLLTGVNFTRKLFRVKNSWGAAWGRRGRAWISFDDFDRLLAKGGEACIGRELEARP